MKLLSWCYYHSDRYGFLNEGSREVLRGGGLPRGSTPTLSGSIGGQVNIHIVLVARFIVELAFNVTILRYSEGIETTNLAADR